MGKAGRQSCRKFHNSSMLGGAGSLKGTKNLIHFGEKLTLMLESHKDAMDTKQGYIQRDEQFYKPQ